MGANDNKAHESGKGWAHRIFSPLIAVFRQGMDPARMAESIAFGTFLGILPLPGVNSILCAAVAVRRGLNMGVIQAVNWFVLPAQIGLFLPMSRLGAMVLRHKPLPMTFDETFSLLKSGPMSFFKAVGFGFVDASLVWCVLGIPACLVLFKTIRRTLERRAKQGAAVKRVQLNSAPDVLWLPVSGGTDYPVNPMCTPISSASVIRRPMHYIAFWQAMTFLMLIFALWAGESLGILHDGPSNVKALILPTTLLVLGGFVAVAHTFFQERRVLNGLITICSYCRKVRINDHVWTQVEQFVSQHSRADFTHGVCPECFKKVTNEMPRDKTAEQRDQRQQRKAP